MENSTILRTPDGKVEIIHEVCGYVLYVDKQPLATTTGDPMDIPYVNAGTLLAMALELAIERDQLLETPCGCLETAFCSSDHPRNTKVKHSNVYLAYSHGIQMVVVEAR